MPCAPPFAEWKSALSLLLSHSDECKWKELPACAIDHFAIKVTATWLRAAISLTPFLYTTCRSAIHRFDVAEDQGGLFEPGEPSNRRQIGVAVHVSIAGAPVGELETRQRLVVDVHRQQVVARVQALIDVVEKVGARQPLSHQASLEVGDGDDHGVDLARLGLADQLLEAELGGLLLAARLSVRPVRVRAGRSFARRGPCARHIESLLLTRD